MRSPSGKGLGMIKVFGNEKKDCQCKIENEETVLNDEYETQIDEDEGC